VWSYVCDVRRWPEWAPTVHKAWVDGAAPLQPGGIVQTYEPVPTQALDAASCQAGMLTRVDLSARKAPGAGAVRATAAAEQRAALADDDRTDSDERTGGGHAVGSNGSRSGASASGRSSPWSDRAAKARGVMSTARVGPQAAPAQRHVLIVTIRVRLPILIPRFHSGNAERYLWK
jgi:hypothetical protein